MGLTKEEKIRKQLEQSLKDDPHNYSRIIELSSRLAQFDTTNVRFTIDAGLVDRLGKELVARQETAVSELVKNAYDADARFVELIFKNSDLQGGTLIIEDDGNGMTREDLINGFMRISSSDKIHDPTSPKFRRLRAGKKGIGRFATQRLGIKLTIITQTNDSLKALRLIINWDDFRTDKELICVPSVIDEVEKTKSHGTTLIIDGLREKWSDESIKKVYTYATDLFQPYPLSDVGDTNDSDPGFKSIFYKESEEAKTVIADETIMFFEHATAEIQGYILEDGQGFWSCKSKKLEMTEEVTVLTKDDGKPYIFTHLRNIFFKAYYFNYSAGLIPRKISTYIREISKTRGGIRIYRNGFRVLPYGEPNDDWIGLDASVRRREILPPHGNINFFGFVQITDVDGKTFNELSSREGLFKNESLFELSDFLFKSLVSSAIKIAEVRGRKTTAGQKDWQKEETPEEIINGVAKYLSEVAKNFEETPPSKNDEMDAIWKNLGSEFRIFSERLTEATAQENQIKQKLLAQVGMLRVLASLGLTVGEFVHEIKHFLPAIEGDSNYLIDVLRDEPNALRRAIQLNKNIHSFTTYTGYFDKVISQNVQRELKPVELRDVVNDFNQIISADVDRSGIQFMAPIFKGFDLFTTPMHYSEWASILFNFYTNSKKAIRRANRKGVLQIECGKESEHVYLIFSDNGDGIPENLREKVFDEFFTTSTPVGQFANRVEELSGSGLGLKIVRDLIESYGGIVSVIEPVVPFSTSMKVIVPNATKEQIDEYGI
jgi:signal transduction histidine kinase